MTATPEYRASVNSPSRRVTQIKVTHGGVTVGIIQDDALISGAVQARISNRVTRTCEFTLPDTYFPETPESLLSPYRAIVQISTGIGYPDGSYEIFPVFTGRIYDAVQGADGLVSFRGDDLAADVVAYRFERPTVSQSGPGTSTLNEIRRLIQQAYQPATFGANDADDAPVPVLGWDEDRGQALDDLASSISSRWYTLGNGDFVVRRFPYVVSPPDIYLSDGPGGAVAEASRAISREAVANGVTVVSERLDGSPPVVSTVHDENPSSPTYFGDLFGKVTRIIKIQTPLDEVQTEALARRQLIASLALSEQWAANIVPDATLELEDMVNISYRGASADQVLDSITYPLTVDGMMTIQGRSSVVPPILTNIADSEATE